MMLWQFVVKLTCRALSGVQEQSAPYTHDELPWCPSCVCSKDSTGTTGFEFDRQILLDIASCQETAAQEIVSCHLQHR